MTVHVVTNDQLTAEASSGRLASFCERRHVILLIAIMVIGAAARIQGLSNGTLYRDDAWVALANHYSISTASHMVVTTPGFTFFERFWIGLAPQTTWFDQLPSLLASVTAIWAIFALTRYFRFSAWISLTCALVLTVSNEATIYATHIKPYAFDLLTACLLLWLGERARRALTLRHLGALAIAGIACTAWSFTNAVIVGGIFITLFAISLHRRQAIGAVVATGGIAAIGLGLIYVAIHAQVTSALQRFWTPNYLYLTSIHSLYLSLRSATRGLLTQELGVYPVFGGLRVFGQIDEFFLGSMIILGVIVAWRRQAANLAIVGLAISLACAHRLPLGSNRTDAYLFPALILIIASGLEWSSGQLRQRLPRNVSTVLVTLCLGIAGFCVGDRLFHVPAYPGGDIRADMPTIDAAMKRPGTMLLVEGASRWVFGYYEDPGASLIFGQQFNTGFTVVSEHPRVVISPHTPQEPNFSAKALAKAVSGASHLVTLNFSDWTGRHDPTDSVLARHCWVRVSHSMRHLYIVNVYDRRASCTPR